MTKIDIISGFLGAGKTTFIKKMIDEAFTGEKIVLIENEFGEVGIDGGFLKDAGIQITEMNSGCICCSLVGDFGKNLNEVITKYHPDRILIEPSGVGKLSDVMKSVIDIEKEQDVKLNALVTVVNALKASKQMKAFGEFFNNQIEYATTVILSRSQNATPEQLEFCVNKIQELNPKAAIITTDWAKLSGEQILKVMEGQDNLEMKALAEAHHAKEEAEHEHEHHHHDHDHEDHEHHHDHEHDENCTVAAMIMRSMSITMSMMKTVPVAAMTMSTITIIMQMTYLPAGARRHRTNLSVQNLRRCSGSLSILTISSAPKGWWRVPMVPGCTLIWFRASMRSVRVSRITPDVSW